MSTLTLSDVTSGYGDIIVVRDMSFTVERASIVGLLGRNGAGKTTTLRTIAGLLRGTRGSIVLDGRDISARPPYQRAAAGVAFVQEGKRIFRSRTVEENLLLGVFATRVKRRQLGARVGAAYERFPVLATRRREAAGALSGGQQQMLAIAQALMRDPSVLLLDEPSAGLAPTVVADLYDVIAGLRDDGLAIVLVEQSVAWAKSVADRIVMIDLGRVIYYGEVQGARADAALERLHLGAELAPEPTGGA